MTRISMMGAAALTLALGACGGEAEGDKKAATKSESASGIVDALDDRKGFAALVETAGLAAAIDGRGAYTVFAPGDAALAALPAGAATDDTAERQRATALVLAHVAPGAMTIADLRKAVEGPNGEATVRTMAGDTLTVAEQDGKLVVAREGVAPVALEAVESRAGDDMVIGIGGPLVGG